MQYHERHLAARKKVEDFLAAVERHKDRRDTLRDAAITANVAVGEMPAYRRRRRKAERLKEEAQAILSDRETYGPTSTTSSSAGSVRNARFPVSAGRSGRTTRRLAQARLETREQRQLARQSARLKFTADTGADTPVRGVLWQFRRVHDWDGRTAERDRQTRSLERWRTLRETWNRQVARASARAWR